MDEHVEPTETGVETGAPAEPRPKAPPIESRFLFVDVAAMRAKQLKRGALPRLGGAVGAGEEPVVADDALAADHAAFSATAEDDEDAQPRQAALAAARISRRPARKLERIAMDEVRQGLVEYSLPDADDSETDTE
jgi:DNA-directed RNA polymerase subunit K/omega